MFGQSLKGKTAIIRAINLIAYNRPSGAKFFSHFAPDKGETEISLKVANSPPVVVKKSVKRKKDKSKELESTTYEYNNDKFTGVARDVPDEIRQLFNISELNIQKQFDQPFLILSSSGEFAKEINRVTKLEKVDSWVSELKRRENKAKNEVLVLEGQAKEIEGELVKYEGIESLATKVSALQELTSITNNMELKKNRLDELLTRIEGVSDELEKIKPALKIEQNIQALISLEQRISTISLRLDLISKNRTIEAYITSLQFVLVNVQTLEKMLIVEEKRNKLDKFLARIELINDAIDDLKVIGANLVALEEFAEQDAEINQLSSYLNRINLLNKSIEEENILYNKHHEEYIDALKNTTECPVFLQACPVVEKMVKEVK
jgi:hypothetical protein